MPLIYQLDPAHPNLDLGRPLQFSDIPSGDAFPLDERDSGSVYCHLCQEGFGDVRELAPLTGSSGVFTRLVLCDMEAPVYLCLEHIPFRHDQFELFSPEVAAALKEAVHQRREAEQTARARRLAERAAQAVSA
jgi:hypothetical protein